MRNYLLLVFLFLSVYGLSQPVNDDPCNAIALDVNSGCVTVSGDNIGATGSNVSNPSCGGYNGEDVWYVLLVPANGSVTISANALSLNSMSIAAYSAPNCSGPFSEEDCSGNAGSPNMNLSGLTPGSYVFVRVFDYYSAGVFGIGADPLEQGTFEICAQSSGGSVTTGGTGNTGAYDCNSTPPAGNTCDQATPICTFDGYCGSTSGYTADYWYSGGNGLGGPLNANGIFCGSIENNSFISFVAGSSTVNLSVEVSGGFSCDDGVQFMMFGSPTAGAVVCNSNSIVSYGCDSPMPPGVNNFTGTGLVPGNTYYLMVDGFAGDQCDYEINALSGVLVEMSAGPDQSICLGESVDLTIYGAGSGAITWTGPYLNTNTGQTVTATPTAPGTYQYIVTAPTISPACTGQATDSDTVNITVTNGASISVSAGPCVNGETIMTASGGVTYTWDPAATVDQTSENPVVATPTVPTTYTVTGADANGCTAQATVSVAPCSLPSPIEVCNNGTGLEVSGGTGVYTWNEETTVTTTTPITTEAECTACGGTPQYIFGVIYNGCDIPNCTSTSTAWTTYATGSTAPYPPNGFPIQVLDDFGQELIFNSLGEIPLCNNACVPPVLVVDDLSACSPSTVDLNNAINAGSGTGNQSFHATQADADAGINPVSSTVGSSGTFYIRYEDPADPGCYSTGIVDVTILPTSNTTETIFLCSGSDYTYPDGTTSTNIVANESQTSTLTAVTGCDSVIVTNITIGSAVTNSVDITLCSGADFTYADGTLSTNITANESNVSTLTAASGCDSLLTENIIVVPTSSTIEDVTLCPGSNYTYPDGTTSTNIVANESQTSTLTSVAGCDSVIVTNITIGSAVTNSVDITLCSGADFTYADGTVSTNITANESNTSTLTAASGCDSLLTENIIVVPTSSTIEDVTLCPGSNYTFPDGTTSTNIVANESQTSTLTSVAGCDSVIVTNITIGSAVTASVDITLCSGADFTYADGTLATNITANESNTSTLTAASGCDSLLTENIIVVPTSSTIEDITLCPGTNYTYPDGTTSTNIVANESQTSTLTAVTGCDSVIVTNITIGSAVTASVDVTLCSGADFTYADGTVSTNITTNESNTSTLTAASGCDSLLTENIIVVPTSSTIEDVTLCPGTNYTYPDGTTSTNIVANESQTSTLTAVTGCDSVIVTNITIGSAVTNSVDITLCSGADFTYADGTVSTNITANESNTSTLTAASGCDSLLTENVYILSISNLVEDVTLCSGSNYVYPDGATSTNITVDESHVSTLTSIAGCDSIVLVNVYVVNAYTTSEDLVICAGDTVQFPDGAMVEGIMNDMSYSSVFVSTAGCDSIVITNVIVDPGPIAGFIASETVLDANDTEVMFTNTSVNATSYLWDFGDGSPNESSVNPVHYYPEAYAGYTVTLFAFSSSGCLDSAQLTIQIEEPLIYYIPNSFTPDGDAFNQTFKPIFTSGYDPFDYNLRIFNRWGEVVFESHNADIGWDGTYNGKLIQDGTYIWKIDFKTTMTDERVMDIGHVNLMK